MADPPAAVGAAAAWVAVADWVAAADSAGSVAVGAAAAAVDASNSSAGHTRADRRNSGPNNRRD
jgi:hypothetical protein